MKKLKFYAQMARIILHLLRGLAITFFIFPWISGDAKKHRVQIWSQQLVRICGVRVKMNLSSIPSAAVVVANHVSWLDIFVINSLAPCRFVAKSDIRAWPMLGWLAGQAGTIYISRGSKADVKRIYQYLIDQIEAGERVAFFPEGTTATQGQVLPFHANLFEAAIHAKVPILPIALRYVDQHGALHDAVDFTGDMSFATSMVNVLSVDNVVAELLVMELIPSIDAHRRELAAAAHVTVSGALQTGTGQPGTQQAQ